MPKKLYAVTNIKTGPEPEKFVAAGSEVDPKALGLSKEALIALHNDGAVEIRTVDDEPVVEETPPQEDDSETDNQTPNGGSQPTE